MFSQAYLRAAVALGVVPAQLVGREPSPPNLLHSVACEVFKQTALGKADEIQQDGEEVCPICTSTEVVQGVCFQCFAFVR